MLNQSLDIKIKGYEVDAAKEKREALPSNYIPKLTLDGSFKYLSEIPEINMAPGRVLKFGDNKNYSIGPTLSMTIFDFNSKANLQTSLDKNLSSKENEAKSLKANILFKVRFHYLNLVFLLEKRDLITESLKVANKQLKDVLSKNRIGSGSKLDLLTAGAARLLFPLHFTFNQVGVLILQVTQRDMTDHLAHGHGIGTAVSHAFLRFAHFAGSHHLHSTGDLLRVLHTGDFIAYLFCAGHC
jgi:hypothetical protein